ncbi:hypothetical protein CBR_g827 [Chara braunii]|uniref:Reverse transcriptase domain-containing protein n=1 Tax=Chara braunii TaxID=69332 RepID=A0A388KCD7_CHABU|nr:hypothetical protein CBR_g827 [Chara braunii]|eukprot:GBG67699.1 hypothetical protein CBR_g827 [Chara braunii]
MGARLDKRMASVCPKLKGKEDEENKLKDEMESLHKENEKLRKLLLKGESEVEDDTVTKLQREIAELRRQVATKKVADDDIFAMKQEIEQLRVSALSKGSFGMELESLRTEVGRLKVQGVKDKKKAELWTGEALRPGNKRGNIAIGTPECSARCSPRPRWTDNLRDSDKWRQEYLKMKEMHRAASFEAEVLKDKRAAAEGEVFKLKEQLSKKATPQRFAVDGAEPAGDVNERFLFIEEQKKDLRNYKKSGLETMCQEAGLKLRSIDLMIADLAEFRADKALGTQSDKGKAKEDEVLVHEAPSWIRNNRNIHALGHCNLVKRFKDEVKMCMDQVGFSVPAVGNRDITGCFSLNGRGEDPCGAFSCPIEEVLKWRDRVKGLVCSPVDHNPGDTLVCCPLLYRKGLDKLFLENTGFEEVRDDETSLLQRMKVEYKEQGLNSFAKWDKNGRLGQAYATPKHKDIAKWRPICPSFAECNVRGSRIISRVVNELVWALPKRSHFNLKSTDLLVRQVKSVNADVGKNKVLLTAAYDVKEMFCNLPHDSIIKALTWLIDFWMRNGVNEMLVKKRGKGAKLMRGKKPDGWCTVEFNEVLDFVKFDLRNTFTTVGGKILRQRIGIPMGKPSSPSIACMLCAHSEFVFLLSLGTDRSLVHGICLIDDVSVFVKFRKGILKEKRRRGRFSGDSRNLMITISPWNV